MTAGAPPTPTGRAPFHPQKGRSLLSLPFSMLAELRPGFSSDCCHQNLANATEQHCWKHPDQRQCFLGSDGKEARHDQTRKYFKILFGGVTWRSNSEKHVPQRAYKYPLLHRFVMLWWRARISINHMRFTGRELVWAPGILSLFYW